MKAHLRILLPLIAALALLTWSASAIVSRLTRTWFEHDVGLRASLVVRGARSTILREWSDPAAVTRLLEDITRDERIMGTAACGSRGELLAGTSKYPQEIDCATALHMVGADRAELLKLEGAQHLLNLPTGEALLSAVPLLTDGGARAGWVVLLHDFSYAERRETATRRYYVVGFLVLALLASVATMFFQRASWRLVRDEFRRLAMGGNARPELAPMLRDVRELAERLANDTQNHPALVWTKERLKETLARTFAGERIVIVSNRQPYIHEKRGDRIEVLHPASGLVTALEPVMRACSGVWVAHGSGSADRETTDRNGRVWVPPGEKLYTTRRVWLTAEEENGYYYGFSNEGLWPLCHVAHTRPRFRASDYAAYSKVNAKFADAVAEEVEHDDPIVLVQDYHLSLAPRLIRERLPLSTVLTFWHIPWPNAERLGICPQHADLLAGLLGSSIVGFHTQQHCNNFLEGVDRFLEARIDRELDAVLYQGRWTLVRAYPISIEWPNRWLGSVATVSECRRIVRDEHGISKDVKIGVGVDRIDYTKGIEERLLAVERMFERHPELVGKFTFIQLGAPSRTKIATYQDLNDQIETLARRIEKRFARRGWTPVIFHRAHHEPHAVFRYYRAADVCYVSSLHDGMNLVAKEFVAARDDEHGVLVLSRFTGAARELTEALVVNPYDLEEASEALVTSIAMPRDEQRERMHALRSYVAEWNVYRWAGRMLTDAARLRQSNRLAGRIGTTAQRPSLARVLRGRVGRLAAGDR
jgi:trehalose 6-phosphate synthase